MLTGSLPIGENRNAVIGGISNDGLSMIPIKASSKGALSITTEFSPSFNQSVVEGGIDGYNYIHKFGRNPDIDGTFEAIWNGGGDYTGFNATGAERVNVVSTSTLDTITGTGARTVKVFGLNADYEEIEETIILAGQAPVLTDASFIRLDRVRVLTAGAGGVNAGTINVTQLTSGIKFAGLPVGYNATMIAAYTVPAGKTAYMTDWFGSLSNKVNGVSNIRLVAREFGEVFQIREELSILADGSSYVQRRFDIPKNSFPEKTDIKIMADSSVVNLAISAGFDLLLKDNT